MRVRVKYNKRNECPPDIAEYVALNPTITKGCEYEVHALAMIGGIIRVQIVDDDEYPAWIPAWLVDMCDGTIPIDWICSMDRDEASLLFGPLFIAKDVQSFDSMALLETDQVDLFWKRIEQIKNSKNED